MQRPFTFFSSWLGNNDIIGYAASGGEGDVLTEKSQFAALYSLAVSQLTKNGAKGVLASLPNETELPYFTTITVNGLIAAAHQANPAITRLYIKALNPVTGKYITRTATEKDLILITFKTSDSGSVVNNLPAYGLIPQNPLESATVLDAAEVAKVQDYIAAYNTTIKSLAYAYGLAYFDTYTYLNNLKAGFVVNGVYVDSKFITGGIFSLDGIHLTPRGNALTADEFIKAINSKYATSIPLVDISQYKGVL